MNIYASKFVHKIIKNNMWEYALVVAKYGRQERIRRLKGYESLCFIEKGGVKEREREYKLK